MKLPESEYDECLSPFENIRKAMGEQFAAQLCKLFGGRRIYVPMKYTSTGTLARHFTDADVETLARLLGGEYIEVPLARTAHMRAVRTRLEAYLRAHPRAKRGATAQKFKVHRRTVQRVRSEMRKQQQAFEAERRGTTSLLTNSAQGGKRGRKNFTLKDPAS